MRPHLLSGRGRVPRAVFAGVAVLATLAGCGGVADLVAPGRPGHAPAGLALSVQLPVLQQAGEVSLRTSATYERTDGSQVPLGTQTVTLSEARDQELPLPVDLGVCLGDAQRRRGSAGGAAGDGTCTVRLTLTLLVDGRVLDEQAIGPFELRPGATFRAGAPVTLFEVSSVRVELPTGAVTRPDGSLRLEVGTSATLSAAALDRAGGVVAGRTASWTSATPAVATVGAATGAVTAVAPGTARVTATVGGREAVVNVAVVPRSQPVTIVAVGSGSGTVVSTPAGIDCRVVDGQTQGTCTFTFPGDAQVSLSAVAQQGSGFGGWADACAGAGTAATCLVTADQARTARVAFGALRTLTVSGAGDGTGTVRSTPGGITCALRAGATCSAPYLDGTTVTLTATPDSTDSFVSWSGDCAGTTTPTCTLTLDRARAATARFARPRALTVGVGGTGEGSVTATVNGVALPCVPGSSTASGTCTASVPFNAVVTLTATPDANSTFTGWSGACSGTGTCSVTADEARTVTAVFARRQVTLTVAVGGAGAGAVIVGGQRCTLAEGEGSRSCALRVDVARALSLSADPAVGSEFAGWSGACTASERLPSCTITLRGDSTVGAAFVPGGSRVVVTGDANTTGGGTVRSADGRFACTVRGAATSGACELAVPVGTTVVLEATADLQSTFGSWTGVCAGTAGPQCTFVVRTTGTTVGVRFLRQQTTLSLTLSGFGGGIVALNGAPACTLGATQSSTTCTRLVDVAGALTLTMVPASGAVALAWGGACAGTPAGSPCTLTAGTSAIAVTASFSTVGSTANVVSVRPAPGYRGSGRVQSSDQAIDCTIAPDGTFSGRCSAPYPAGTSVTLALTSFTMQQFTGAWSGACVSSGPTCTFTVPAGGGTVQIALPAASGVAVTGTGAGTITVQAPGQSAQQYTVTAASSPAPPVVFPAYEGQTVTLTAAGAAAGGFRQWTGDCAASGTSPVCTLTLAPGAATATVNGAFDFAVPVTVTGDAGGSVTVQGITGATTVCTRATGGTTSCTLRAPTATTTLVAAPVTGAAFSAWSGAPGCSTSPTCTVDLRTLTGPVTAVFDPVPVTIQIDRDPAGAGSGLVVGPTGTCTLTASGRSGTCTEQAFVGFNRVYTASALTGSAFAGWGGLCAGQSGPTCTLPVVAGGTVTARFDVVVITPVLTVQGVTVGLPGSGNVTSTSPAGVNCDINGTSTAGTCSTAFPLATNVTLLATPAVSSIFAGWSGACSGSTVSCVVPMSQSRTVGARFAPLLTTLTLGFDPASTGRRLLSVPADEIECLVDPSSGGVPTGSGCTGASVKNVTPITIVAEGSPTSGFVGWTSGPCVGVQSMSCTFTIDGATTVIGRFGALLPATLEIDNGAIYGTGQVTVQTIRGSTPYTASTSGVHPISLSVYAGDVVRFTATGSGGALFDGWSGECAAFGTNPVCTVSNDFPSHLVRARFVEGSALRARRGAVRP